jgi:hypothetical protein
MSHKRASPFWALVYSGAEFLIVLCVRISLPEEPRKSALFISGRIPVNDISTPMVSIILYMLLNDDVPAMELAKECADYQYIQHFAKVYQENVQGSVQTPVNARKDAHASHTTVSEVRTILHVCITH